MDAIHPLFIFRSIKKFIHHVHIHVVAWKDSLGNGLKGT